jgi:hypothetical protein
MNITMTFFLLFSSLCAHGLDLFQYPEDRPYTEADRGHILAQYAKAHPRA